MSKWFCFILVSFLFGACNFDHLDPKPYWDRHSKEAETANRVLPTLTDEGKLPTASTQEVK